MPGGVGGVAPRGVPLSRFDRSTWVGGSAALLRLLVDALAREVVAAEKLQSDDRPVPVPAFLPVAAVRFQWVLRYVTSPPALMTMPFFNAPFCAL